ncbi:MAG TPA: hypothetical protein PLU17_08445 [Chitinophagaceae bacterium]|nr:hypothetical protein [Chitinophagaceae bacterium]
MSIKYTPATLKKFEELYDEIGYSIRFEKGNFHSGYCILQDRRIAVINKFLPLEGRINALIDILPGIEVDQDKLNKETLHFYLTAMAIPVDR